MASEATPRVNAKYLESFTNQTVRILGKVITLRGETAIVDANGSINVHLNRVSGQSLRETITLVEHRRFQCEQRLTSGGRC